MMTANYVVDSAKLLSLAGELLHRRAKFIRLHSLDDFLFFGVELLFGRGEGSLVDQRLGTGDRSGRILRQPFGELSRRRLQLWSGNDPGDQTPIMGLLCREAVFGQEYLQRTAGADRAHHADRAAAVRRHTDLGIGRG